MIYEFDTKVVERIYSLVIDNERMNIQLINLIDSIGDEVKYKSNVKALTTFNLINRNFAEIDELCKIINNFSKECAIKEQHAHPNHVKRLGMESWREEYIDKPKVNAIWGTRYEGDEITIPHDHWPSIWAFTYYIDPPKNAQGLWITDANAEIPIEHGKLLLFRGHVIHETKPIQLNDYRYCIAGTVN